MSRRLPAPVPASSDERARWIEAGQRNPEGVEVFYHAIDTGWFGAPACEMARGAELCPFEDARAAANWSRLYKLSRERAAEYRAQAPVTNPHPGAAEAAATPSDAPVAGPDGVLDPPPGLEDFKRFNVYHGLD